MQFILIMIENLSNLQHEEILVCFWIVFFYLDLLSFVTYLSYEQCVSCVCEVRILAFFLLHTNNSILY